MAFHPNFAPVAQIADTDLKIEGVSTEIECVLQTLVVIEFNGNVAHRVAPLESPWTVLIPLSELGGEPPTDDDTVFAFGSETRKDPLASVTWVQTLDVE